MCFPDRFYVEFYMELDGFHVAKLRFHEGQGAMCWLWDVFVTRVFLGLCVAGQHDLAVRLRGGLVNIVFVVFQFVAS